MNIEAGNIIERYKNRENEDFLDPYIFMILQERERALLSLLKKLNKNISELKILEIGSGFGINILKFIEYGFTPENITGIELLEKRVESSTKLLPKEVTLIKGDALEYNFKEKYDLIFLFGVYSSILDEEFQKKLTDKIENLLTDDGGIVWYDFTYDNPRNKGVRGIKLSKIKSLFRGKILFCNRITLAPPISRRIVKINPSLYNIFNLLPFLRTHLLCFIKK
ncbi:MAG TPA: class I SAM-dependent methyltransferase [Ignavibacteriaceae bacterium]|nr:class I SAM-dependent methyltransferase [Ignavibacteriaceae bacterium]